jgi:hypothetical protein
MTTPEERSDQLDERILRLASGAYIPSRRAIGMVGALIIVAFTAQFVLLWSSSRSNHDAITKQIPALEKTIADQQYVINQQAVPAIVYMLEHLREAGITPPSVLLGPQHPPFKKETP